MGFMFVTISNTTLLFTQQVNKLQVNKKVSTLMNRALKDYPMPVHTVRETGKVTFPDTPCAQDK